MSTEDWVCERCGVLCGESEDWTPADVAAETSALFPGALEAPVEERGVLCDTCWQEFMAWMHQTHGPPPWPHIAGVTR